MKEEQIRNIQVKSAIWNLLHQMYMYSMAFWSIDIENCHLVINAEYHVNLKQTQKQAWYHSLHTNNNMFDQSAYYNMT